MKNLLLVLIFSAAAWGQEQKAPFTLAIVPSRSDPKYEVSISRVPQPRYKNENRPVEEFYLVISNVSDKPQPVFEFWNSWGAASISLVLTTANGKEHVLARTREIFTKNGPDTFTVQPGEHQVYAIRLDYWWEARPELPAVETLPVTVKAIYNVEPPTGDEAKGTDDWDRDIQSVWVGRVESKSYKLLLRQRLKEEPELCLKGKKLAPCQNTKSK